MEVKINLSNKLFYVFVLVGVFVLLGVGVYAYGTSDPEVFGHTADELNWTDDFVFPDAIRTQLKGTDGATGPAGPAGTFSFRLCLCGTNIRDSWGPEGKACRTYSGVTSTYRFSCES